MSAKKSDDDEVNGLSNVNNGDDRSHLKPKLEPGDEVYSAWWAPNDVARSSVSSWNPGVVLSYREVLGTYSPYGPTRKYDIMYENGDILHGIEDHLVYPKDDYILYSNREDWVGVKNVTDGHADDKWAKFIGWYSAKIDGEEQSFSRLIGEYHYIL